MRLGLTNTIAARGTPVGGDGLALDLQFAADKTLTARKGPTPVFSRGSSGTFVNANGLIVGKTAGNTASITPSTQAIGSQVTVTVASGSVVGWVVGQAVSLIVDTDGQDDPDATELWLLGNIVSATATQLVFEVTQRTGQSGSATSWTLGYRGPRFDHDPANPTVCRGLLIEESRTNLLRQSGGLSTSPWAAVSGATLTSGSSAPDSSTGGVEVSGVSGSRTTQGSLSLTSGQVYTLSVFLKQGTASLGRVSFFDGTNFFVSTFTWSTLIASGTGGGSLNYTSTTTNFGNGWYRVTFTFTSTTTTANADCSTGLSSTGTIFAWGAQLEAGSFATSYIPTTTASVVRSADVCSITGAAFSGFYNQIEGTVYTESRPATVNGTTTTFGLSNGTLNERWLNRFAQNEQVVITSAGTESALDALNPVAGTLYKVATAGKLNDFSMSINGLAVVTDTSQPMPVVDRAGIGNALGAVAGSGAVTIAAVRYYKKRLPNAKLQALTA